MTQAASSSNCKYPSSPVLTRRPRPSDSYLVQQLQLTMSKISLDVDAVVQRWAASQQDAKASVGGLVRRWWRGACHSHRLLPLDYRR